MLWDLKNTLGSQKMGHRALGGGQFRNIFFAFFVDFFYELQSLVCVGAYLSRFTPKLKKNSEKQVFFQNKRSNILQITLFTKFGFLHPKSCF